MESVCHPGIKHRSKGLCVSCYYKERKLLQTVKTPTCHPDKPYAAKGLCRNCYDLYRFEVKPILRKKRAEAVKKWRSNNVNKCKEYGKERLIRNKLEPKDAQRNRHLWRTYKITLDDFNSLIKTQNNTCKICLKELSNNFRLTHIDHDHNTGKVRGILCFKCNHGLGLLGDTKEYVQKFLDYLINPPAEKFYAT